tara:strand:- start:33928 stop:34836 length:909 start_codon:yes stop_codon:yes gene_type:complete
MSETGGWTDIPTNQPMRLSNQNCAYCGQEFDASLHKTKEHVVARRFVPKGSMDGAWNLIANACEPCNRAKADLEDDISAITMLPDQYGRYAVEDPRLKETAERKAAKSGSRKTGKAVAKSGETSTVEASSGSLKMSFGFSANPQIDQKRIFSLANFHWRAFFYMITYSKETQRGGCVPGQFMPVGNANRMDWGNDQMRWFMGATDEWDPRLKLVTADGYFKKSIRRDPSGLEVWAWALEWNQNQRVIGFAGKRECLDVMAEDLPMLRTTTIAQSPGRFVRYRKEIPLEPEDDTLFRLSGEGS